jgi:hypothetical protein
MTSKLGHRRTALSLLQSQLPYSTQDTARGTVHFHGVKPVSSFDNNAARAVAQDHALLETRTITMRGTTT